jgi:serine protease
VASTQFDETTTFYSNWGKEIDVAAPGGNTRVDQNGDGKPDGVLQTHHRPAATAQRLPVVHGHVDGLAARGGRGRADRGRRHPQAGRGRGDPAGHRAQAQGQRSQGARVDDHYGAGIVDAAAALRKAKDGRARASWAWRARWRCWASC